MVQWSSCFKGHMVVDFLATFAFGVLFHVGPLRKNQRKEVRFAHIMELLMCNFGFCALGIKKINYTIWSKTYWGANFNSLLFSSK